MSGNEHALMESTNGTGLTGITGITRLTDHARAAAEAADLGHGETSFAPVSQEQFVEPWHRRVRDVDDHTVAGLLQQLMSLRRMRNGVAVLCCVLGMGVFGHLDVHGLYAVLIYGVLAAMVGMPVFAIGSLSVRRLFLREARRQGLSRSAAMLVLTRAERRARLLTPWQGDEAKIDALLQAVREPDTAS